MKQAGTVAEAQSYVGALPFGLKFGWGFGAFGAAILVNGIAVFIFFYMVGILKIEPALAGAIVFATKLIDVATDPVMGIISDRHRSPAGRRRPFLPAGAVLSGLSMALIFSAPAFGNDGLAAAYMFVALTVYTVGYTIFNVPYMTMPAEMTDSYHERSSIHGYRIVMVTIATFAATLVAPYVIEQIGRTDRSSYRAVGLVGAALVLASMLAAYFSTARARFSNRGSSAASALVDFRSVLANRHLLRLIGVKLAQLTGFQTTQAALLFFILQSLQLGFDVLLLLGAVTSAVSVLATPLILALSRRWGKRAGYYVSATATIAVAASWTFAGPGEPYWALALRAALSGVAFSGNVMMAMSMLTDIINHDANVSGARREGAFVALYSFVEKLTAAVGPLIIGVALSLAGFDTALPPDVPQGGDVDTAILLAVSWLPALLGIVAVVLLSGYRLTEEAIAGALPGPASREPANSSGERT